MPTILIADDEPAICKAMELILKEYRVESAFNKKEAIKTLRDFSIDLLICDLHFPEIEDGLSLIKATKELSPETFIVVLTGHGSIESAVQAIKEGADDYLVKGISNEELKLKIETYLKLANERLKLGQMRALTQVMSEQKGDIQLIGESPAMLEVRAKVERAGKESRMSVLISGETGTGKEVVARMIHSLGPSAKYPFLPIDCPSIPENLFESELFGYEKGAFTDAKARKLGKIELAGGGTLYLDEIADLPLMLQPKLLRFLETGEFFRLGGTMTIKVDTRVIASTNQNLEELVKSGKFREDLYYRLKVFVITLPPLRERREDIPILVEHFLNIFDPQKKKRHLITEELIDAFTQYHWPGNVRELRNTIESLLVAENREELLKILHISFPQRFHPGFSMSYKAAKQEALKNFEIQYFKTVLQEEDWNITKAAKRVGISREELQRKIKRFGMKRDKKI